MMPKEVLTDRSIRAEVLPGLSLSRICTLLERFQPDDFSADPLPRGQSYISSSAFEQGYHSAVPVATPDIAKRHGNFVHVHMMLWCLSLCSD